MTGPGATLVVLARAPRRGAGKTRLRAALAAASPGGVDALVEALVADTLAAACAGPRPVSVAGRGALGALRRLAPGARLLAQPRADFGSRVEAALAAGLDAGRGALQVGSDSPTLPAWLLAEAEAALAGADCALVPAEDGGWVALGTRRRLDGALAGAAVRWSTSHAAADTRAALEASGLSVARLPAWYDVDDAAGLERLAADPQAPRRAPRSLAALAALGGEAAA